MLLKSRLSGKFNTWIGAILRMGGGTNCVTCDAVLGMNSMAQVRVIDNIPPLLAE